jgi:hypothetical protein
MAGAAEDAKHRQVGGSSSYSQSSVNMAGINYRYETVGAKNQAGG